MQDKHKKKCNKFIKNYKIYQSIQKIQMRVQKDQKLKITKKIRIMNDNCLQQQRKHNKIR